MSAERADASPQPPAMHAGRFSGRREFQQWLHDAFATAARERWKDMILCDASFHDWPLGERSVIDSLDAWAKGGGHLTLLARRYDDLRSLHPRFVRWRTIWSHRVEARACRHADALELPSALWSPGWVLQRVDPVRCHGVAGFEPERRVALREGLQEWLRQSSPAFAPTTLGL